MTSLSLVLYGIGADFVASEGELEEAGIPTRQADGEERWKYWPEYATSLIFELIRDRCPDKGDKYYVRISLNGKDVRLISTVLRSRACESESGKETTLNDFSNIINRIGHVHAKIEDDRMLRDMSTWTG